MIGPFIFFDHMGPAIFPPGQGISVRPHPHINLATVTYLFEGKIRHRDSLGSVQDIEPGAVNWMIAGHGIVHSERTPEEVRNAGSRLNGIQCWIALPNGCEEMTPSFTHHPARSIPQFIKETVTFKLLLGSAFEYQSPVSVQSKLFYLHAHFPKGSQCVFPVDNCEIAAYVVVGRIKANQQEVPQCSMIVGQDGKDMMIEALESSQVMLLGGEAIGQRYIYWNFVSSTEEKIEKAKQEWAAGPGEKNSRFPKIPGDDKEFIPLPDEGKDKNPKGTIM
jgi:redox-sensitive bicupin YhaK (pirin superfamily)